MMTFKLRQLAALAALGALAGLAACGDVQTPVETAEHAAAAPADFERGPHNGRLLRDGNFSVEVTVFEDGVPPEFRVYPFVDNRPVDPRQVQLGMAVSRLGGEVNRFNFRPQQDFLRADAVVHEPHSFDVAVRASEGGRTHDWAYASYEGRTTIAAAAAETAGVKTEAAGPATIEETIDLYGRVEVNHQARVEVRATYPGRVLAMTKLLGAKVQRGEMIASVESSSSLQAYSISAPMSGVIVERNTNVGDLTEGRTLYVIADITRLHAELNVHQEDADRIRVGQPVLVSDIDGEKHVLSKIEVIIPTANPVTQTLISHSELPGDGNWRPGMGVEGRVTVASFNVPLAVRTPALQRFRDFMVVYAKVGDTYEVRMLQLGRQTAEWTEVLGGLQPGTEYVTENAFLIRADVEKSGATHDH